MNEPPLCCHLVTSPGFQRRKGTRIFPHLNSQVSSPSRVHRKLFIALGLCLQITPDRFELHDMRQLMLIVRLPLTAGIYDPSIYLLGIPIFPKDNVVSKRTCSAHVFSGVWLSRKLEILICSVPYVVDMSRLGDLSFGNIIGADGGGRRFLTFSCLIFCDEQITQLRTLKEKADTSV